MSSLLLLAARRHFRAAVGANPSPGSLVTFPSLSWAALAGPLATMGPGYSAASEADLGAVDTSVVPSPWYDYNLAHAGLTLGRALPQKPMIDLSGTIGVTNGSLTVTGVGTAFLSEVGKGNRICTQDGAGNWVPAPSGLVASVESDTSLTLAAPWAGSTLSGLPGSTFRSSDSGMGVESYWAGYSDYYDYTYSAYQQYHRLRSADPAAAGDWLSVARTSAETWWGSASDYAPNYGAGLSIAPRGAAAGGLFCRALDEDEEVGVPGTSRKWDWLYRFCQMHWNNWIYTRRTYSSLYYGVRDPGYSFLYAAWLVRFLPDTYPTSDGTGTVTDGAAKRAALLAQLIEVSVGTGVDVPNSYYRRIQTVPPSAIGPAYQVRGLWVWSDDAPYDRYGYFAEPWHIGLLMEGMIALHRLLVDVGGYAAEAAELRTMILEAVDGAYALGNVPTGSLVMKSPGVPLDGTTKYRTWAYAVNNDQIPPNDLAELAGALTLVPGSTTVTGTGTQLVTEGLAAGERVRFYRPLTGTLALTNASASVTGTGTSFLSELKPGELIVVLASNADPTWGTVYLRVESIQSDTQLTLSCPTTRKSASALAAWREVFNHLPGTVSATNGSAILVGSGTSFLSQFDAAGTPTKPRVIWLNTVEDAGGGQHDFAWRGHEILSVDSDTQITLVDAFAQITRADLRYANTQGGDYVVDTVTEGGITLLSPIVDTAPLSAAVTGGGWKVHRKWQGGPGYLTGTWDTNAVRDTRQNLPTAIHMFGYAYYLTGDAKYLAWGDEMLESAFGKGHGTAADPYYCLADYTSPGSGQRGKEYNQSYRTSGHYLGWRLMPPSGG